MKIKTRGEEINSYLKKFMFSENKEPALLNSDQRTVIDEVDINGSHISRFTNEFWTSKQRQSCSIHEISYRACFKAQLPGFFIELLTKPGDTVYDPFSGRGTTVLEAAILGRRIISNDINPLSGIITYPRFRIPGISEISSRLDSIPVEKGAKADRDLSMFYHPVTEAEIVSLKRYLDNKKRKGTEDDVDRWIRMVATNRLTGHSPGFFSVYTMPPNQAVSAESQIKINKKRGQKPDYRDSKRIIIVKTKSLLRNSTPAVVENLKAASESALFLEKDARDTQQIEGNRVNLTVTSPPFLDVVQYSKDNWLRCWFNDIDTGEIERKITLSRTVEEWAVVMGQVLKELHRLTKPGGWVAFEVGEVRRGKINLEEYVVPQGLSAGFECSGVVVNRQQFTKTSNIWGIKNNRGGTNTNRIVLFRKAS